MSAPSGNEHGLRAALRRLSGRAAPHVDLAFCDPLEKEQMARDVGVSSGELGQLIKSGSDAADQLQQRMAALDLDPQEVARVSPAIVRDMQRLCALCKKHRRCARDLAHNAADPVWKEYCPNLEPLTSLDAMPWATRNEW